MLGWANNQITTCEYNTAVGTDTRRYRSIKQQNYTFTEFCRRLLTWKATEDFSEKMISPKGCVRDNQSGKNWDKSVERCERRPQGQGLRRGGSAVRSDLRSRLGTRP